MIAPSSIREQRVRVLRRLAVFGRQHDDGAVVQPGGVDGGQQCADAGVDVVQGSGQHRAGDLSAGLVTAGQRRGRMWRSPR